MLNEILPHSVRSLNDEFWDNFRSYLTNEQHSPSSIRDKISYAKRFYFVLEYEDALSLTQLTPDVKSHVMKSLANLSKFIGKYDRWLEVVKKHPDIHNATIISIPDETTQNFMDQYSRLEEAANDVLDKMYGMTIVEPFTEKLSMGFLQLWVK